MDKVFIHDLHVTGILGVNEEERTTPRDILINVSLYTTPRRLTRPDSLEGCVDYSLVANEIRAWVGMARKFTVEALAEDIAGLCLKHAHVRKVTVRVEKPGAIQEAGSAGVEIERWR
jgi:FolB domain-containing protein